MFNARAGPFWNTALSFDKASSYDSIQRTQRFSENRYKCSSTLYGEIQAILAVLHSIDSVGSCRRYARPPKKSETTRHKPESEQCEWVMQAGPFAQIHTKQPPQQPRPSVQVCLPAQRALVCVNPQGNHLSFLSSPRPGFMLPGSSVLGSSKQKVAPPPGVSCTQSRPPWRAVSSAATARPRP